MLDASLVTADFVADPYATLAQLRDEDPVRSKRVTDARLKMVKLDIAALEAAYRG